jgi:microcystin-dependent protein
VTLLSDRDGDAHPLAGGHHGERDVSTSANNQPARAFAGNLQGTPGPVLQHRRHAGHAAAEPDHRRPGGNQPHNNMMPTLFLNYCIALQGAFPARN